MSRPGPPDGPYGPHPADAGSGRIPDRARCHGPGTASPGGASGGARRPPGRRPPGAHPRYITHTRHAGPVPGV